MLFCDNGKQSRVQDSTAMPLIMGTQILKCACFLKLSIPFKNTKVMFK